MPRGTDLLNEASLQQRLWNPRHLLIQSTASPIWFDASDLSTITTNASNFVTAWRNKFSTPIDRTLSQNGTQNITLKTTVLNGLSVVNFIATSFLTMPQVYNNANTSYFIVLMREGTGNITPMLESGSNHAYLQYGDVWYFGPFSAHTVPVGAFEWYLGTCVSGEKYKNGLLRAGSIVTGTQATFLTVGSGFSNNTWNLAELLVLEKVASQYERQLIEGYLAWKWGIRLAANHPYVNRPPLIGD